MTENSEPSINARPRLRIDGELRTDISAALLDMRVSLPLSGMANAEIRCVNWHSNATDGDADFAFQALGLGDTLEVLAGDSDEDALFSGEITAIEERYGDGAPQIVYLAEDKLHRLARSRENRIFEDMSINDVVNSVAAELGLAIDAQVSDTQGSWHQLNESKLAFLLRLLAPYDIALRIVGSDLRARLEEQDAEPETLHPQNNVQRMRITADLNHQLTEASIKGHDLGADETVASHNDSLIPSASGETAADILQTLSWGQSEIFPQPFARSSGEAQGWAESRFRHRAKKFLYGDIVCAGTPSLRSGREVELVGVSERLRGKYQVVDCQHLFNNSAGYVTCLKVQRGSWSN